jgi:hypothetical protein
MSLGANDSKVGANPVATASLTRCSLQKNVARGEGGVVNVGPSGAVQLSRVAFGSNQGALGSVSAVGAAPLVYATSQLTVTRVASGGAAAAHALDPTQAVAASASDAPADWFVDERNAYFINLIKVLPVHGGIVARTAAKSQARSC